MGGGYPVLGGRHPVLKAFSIPFIPPLTWNLRL